MFIVFNDDTFMVFKKATNLAVHNLQLWKNDKSYAVYKVILTGELIKIVTLIKSNNLINNWLPVIFNKKFQKIKVK